MRRNIVIIDDCELIKLSLLKTLPDYAPAFQFYDNLSAALKELKEVKSQQKYIFILDLEIVTHNGIREITETMAKDCCDIIVLTSMPLAHVEKETGGMNIVKIFTKPFNVRELTEAILHLENAV
ncbi:MAG: hypothetical protein M1591_00220 [Deltaproteobacteria bacterium]|nr:hypothetical protein [Deltaproteobacteria bacterium]